MRRSYELWSLRDEVGALSAGERGLTYISLIDAAVASLFERCFLRTGWSEPFVSLCARFKEDMAERSGRGREEENLRGVSCEVRGELKKRVYVCFTADV